MIPRYPPPHDFDRKLCFDNRPKMKQPPNEPLRNAKRENYVPPTYAQLYAAFEVMTTTGALDFATTVHIEPSHVDVQEILQSRRGLGTTLEPDPSMKRYGYECKYDYGEAATSEKPVSGRGALNDEMVLIRHTRRTYTFRNMIKAIDPNWPDSDEFRSQLPKHCGDAFAATMPAVLISIIAEYAWDVPPNTFLLYSTAPRNPVRKTVLARCDDKMLDLHYAMTYEMGMNRTARARPMKKEYSIVIVDRSTAWPILWDIPLYAQLRSGTICEGLPPLSY